MLQTLLRYRGPRARPVLRRERERECDDGQRSIAETEDIMSAAEGDQNAGTRPGVAEEGGPTAATRPAAAEEGDRTAAARAAASAASQENKRCERTYWAARAAAYGASQENDVCKNDVCSYCQYRGRKLKHTQDS